VEIKAIAREAGLRTKVAVAATQENVDPVGSCVGVRGVRIQNIVTELYGEKIDVVEWSSDTATFIAKALSPAKVLSVSLDEVDKIARVIVPTDQMSLAIGKEGQNARLAHKLTDWRIDVKDTEALKAGGDDLIRQAQAAALAQMPDAFANLGRRPALVLADATVVLDNVAFGPVPENLIGRSVDVEQLPDRVEIFYERDLIGTYNADGTPFTGEAVVAAPMEAIAVTATAQRRFVRGDGTFVFENEFYGPLPGGFTGEYVMARREDSLVVVTDETDNQIATFPVKNG
jgi:N utilization substance protein A